LLFSPTLPFPLLSSFVLPMMKLSKSIHNMKYELTSTTTTTISSPILLSLFSSVLSYPFYCTTTYSTTTLLLYQYSMLALEPNAHVSSTCSPSLSSSPALRKKKSFSTHTHTARFQFLKPEDTKRWWQELPISLHCIGLYTYYMYQLWYLSTYF
jgi:hypothetical protein